MIQSRQLEVRHSQALAQSEDNLMNRLNSLSAQDTKGLLTKYFEKVVSLREQERKLNLHSSSMEVSIISSCCLFLYPLLIYLLN